MLIIQFIYPDKQKERTKNMGRNFCIYFMCLNENPTQVLLNELFSFKCMHP